MSVASCRRRGSSPPRRSCAAWAWRYAPAGRRRCASGGLRGRRLGRLDVRGVVAVLARDDGVLARPDEHLELGARRAADGARVGLHHAVRQPHAVEDPHVRLAHALVALGRARLVGVERVRVLHVKLAPAEQPPAGPRLVAELHLHLVERLRQIAPAPHLAARDVGDNLFVRRPEVVVAALAVPKAQEHVAVEVPAARLLEVVGRQRARASGSRARRRGPSPRGRWPRPSGGRDSRAAENRRCRRRPAGCTPSAKGARGSRWSRPPGPLSSWG